MPVNSNTYVRCHNSTYEENCGYNKRFKYNIPISTTGIPYPWIVWCAENCKYRWGWWFSKKTKEARMSFEDRNESIFWCLKWAGTNK